MVNVFATYRFRQIYLPFPLPIQNAVNSVSFSNETHVHQGSSRQFGQRRHQMMHIGLQLTTPDLNTHITCKYVKRVDLHRD